MESVKPFEIGIASSVAKANGYSWLKTIEYARAWEINLIQLYIGEDFSQQLTNLGDLSLLEEFNIFWHLPNNISTIDLNNLILLKRFSKNFILHQDSFPAIAGMNDFFYPVDLYLENDHPYMDSSQSYFSFIIEKYKMSGNYYSAFDVPRFFEQHFRYIDFQKIEAMSREIIDYHLAADRKILLHLIDLTDLEGLRTGWKTLFSGILPLRTLLQSIKKSKKRIPIILEYESPETCYNSILVLNNFMKLATE
jgi:hypothetical protein